MKIIQLKCKINEIPSHLGLEETDTLFFATDVSRLAMLARKKNETLNLDQLVDAFLEQVPRGNLIVPAYTDNLRNGETFDWKKSKPTTGALSNKVLKRSDFTRTKDPLHSVLVKGVDSQEILALKDKSTFGEQSVFAFMDRKNGKMLFIDVTLNQSFTYLHYLEEKWNVSYRKFYKKKIKVVEDGKVMDSEVLFYTKKAGFLANIEKFEQYLKEEGIIQQYDYEGIPLILLKFSDINVHARKYLDGGGKFYRFNFPFLIKSIAKQLLGRD